MFKNSSFFDSRLRFDILHNTICRANELDKCIAWLEFILFRAVLPRIQYRKFDDCWHHPNVPICYNRLIFSTSRSTVFLLFVACHLKIARKIREKSGSGQTFYASPSICRERNGKVVHGIRIIMMPTQIKITLKPNKTCAVHLLYFQSKSDSFLVNEHRGRFVVFVFEFFSKQPNGYDSGVCVCILYSTV